MDSLDSMFQPKKYKNNTEWARGVEKEKTEMQTFESRCLQQESKIVYMQLGQEKLEEIYRQEESVKTKAAENGSEVLSDMPKQQVDEKESTRKKKEKAQLKKERTLWEEKQEETAQRLNERIADIKNKAQTFDQIPLDEQAMALFDDKIDAQTLTPRYVLEHFAEVREKLDAWKTHIEIFSSEGELYGYLPDEYRVRFCQMGVMYHQSEKAFASALGALGYRYQPQAKGDKQLVNDLTEDEKKQKLDENRKQREALADTAAKMDEETANEMYQQKSRYFRRSDDGVDVRKEMSKNPRYAFIQSKYLNTREQYEEIAEIKDLTAQYAQQYEANKENVNKLYMEFYKLLEADARCRKEIYDLDSMRETMQICGMQKVRKCFEDRSTEEKKRQDTLNRHARSIKAGIRHILCGERLRERDILVLKDYFPEKYEQLTNETEAQALAYTQKYQEKQGIFENAAEQFFGDQAKEMTDGAAGSFMVLVKAGEQAHNEQVMRSLVTLKTYQTMKRAGGAVAEEAELEMGRTMKPLVMPYLARIGAFDTAELENATPKELTARNAELQELALLCQNISDLGKYRDPDNARKCSIIESACGGEPELFTLKCEVIVAFAEKARAFSIMRAYGAGTLKETALMPEEKEKLEKKEDGSISTETILDFSKALFVKSRSREEAAYRRYFKGKEAKPQLAEKEQFRLPSSHPKLDDGLKRAKQHGKTALRLKVNMGSGDIEKYYRLQKTQVVELREKWKTYKDPAILEKVEQLEEELSYLEIQYALSERNYRMAGDKDTVIKEAIFRSYTSADSLDSFRNMGEENFIQMCRQLSAGALAENASPEEIKTYHEENVKGLLTYKEHMKEHYMGLEEKFHHRVPTLAYIVEHYKELKMLIANTQVDLNLVKNSKDMIDLRKEEDARLYHLVQYYHALGSYIPLVYKASVHGGGDYKKEMQMAAFELRDVNYSARYLDEDHSAMTEDEQEKRAELAAVVEKFRDVYIDTKHDQRDATWEQQMELFQRIEEMTEYLEQHPETSSIEQEHIRDLQKYSRDEFDAKKSIWAKKQNSGADRISYNFVLTRHLLNEKEPEREGDFSKLAETLSAYEVTEEMLTFRYIDTHIEELLVSFDTIDAYYEKLKAEPELERMILPKQKLLWEKNRVVYKKYREYVADYARSLYVDIASGKFLPEENKTEEEKLAEKIKNDKNLAEEKDVLKNLLGGFSGYAEKVNTLSEKIKAIENLEENGKTAILKSLSEAGEWLRDLTEYTKKPLVLSPEDMFDTMIMTLMSMYGYLEKNLREAREAFKGALGEELGNELLAEMQEISNTFLEFKESIPGQAQEMRKLILESGGEIELTIRDLIARVQEKKIFVINGEVQNVGVGMSDVLKITEGEKTFFFKADEKLRSFQSNAKEILPMLKNEEIENYFKMLLDQPEDPTILGMVGKVIYVPKKGNEEQYYANIKGDYLQFLHDAKERGVISEEKEKTLAQKMNTDASEMEKWEEFLKLLAKKSTSTEAAENSNLLLNEGADMTARNYASERVAELLGLKNLIVRNREAIVEKNGVEEKGFVMDKAEGVTAKEVAEWKEQGEGRELRFSANAQKQLLNLQILDNIIGQYDRHMGNYYFQCEKTDKVWTVIKVTAIDNDLAFGQSKKVGGSLNTPSVLKKQRTKTENGWETQYTYYPDMMDKEMYESLRAVSPELLAANLEGVIEPEYLDALKSRYETIRSAVMKAADEKSDFFREKGGWNERSQKQMADQAKSEDGATMTYIKRMF